MINWLKDFLESLGIKLASLAWGGLLLLAYAGTLKAAYTQGYRLEFLGQYIPFPGGWGILTYLAGALCIGLLVLGLVSYLAFKIALKLLNFTAGRPWTSFVLSLGVASAALYFFGEAIVRLISGISSLVYWVILIGFILWGFSQNGGSGAPVSQEERIVTERAAKRQDDEAFLSQTKWQKQQAEEARRRAEED